jgi:hypothetical protein
LLNDRGPELLDRLAGEERAEVRRRLAEVLAGEQVLGEVAQAGRQARADLAEPALHVGRLVLDLVERQRQRIDGALGEEFRPEEERDLGRATCHAGRR